ncbi:MAG TPA: hypothetical protein VEY32_09560 [Flavisolibacter sp.]|jgi:hypothetical protein|nr:hypothetical protein [Flavisolibacter sp.]
MINQDNKRESSTSSQDVDTDRNNEQKSINPFEQVNQGDGNQVTEEDLSLEQQKKEAMSERD